MAANLARNLVALRHARALTQATIAKAAGVPRSTIANLESGAGNPSLTVLLKVANSLGAPLDELLASPRAKVRRWSAADITSNRRGHGVTLRPLVPEPVPEQLLTVMDFAPGGAMNGTPHLPGTREFFTCLDGTITIQVAGDDYQLASGDVLAFPGNVPHSYHNTDSRRAAHGVSIVVLAKAGI
ncbi:MAG TPA: cupin domain-containing protein [Planctomycetota bacterium]|nr:cupin domain-containing protein [Planctomycetota bacterium]